MAYQLRIKPSAEKKLEKTPEKDYLRVLFGLSEIANNPLIGKKLEGEFTGCFSFRVWPYRIIYEIYKKELIVLVISIGHRQGVYKK